MKHKLLFATQHLKEKIRKATTKGTADVAGKLRKYGRFAGHPVLSATDSNKMIYDAIQIGAPFFAGRMGGNELSAMKMFDFEVESKYAKVLDYLCINAGFFPHEVGAGKQFSVLLKESIPCIDLSGTLVQPFEEYYFQKYAAPSMCFTHLFDLEPWKCPEAPWTAALAGKKVLVIHPLSELIEKQYQRRSLLFPENEQLLPTFELKTLKAVQTIAGEKDDRFANWFEALEWMYQEALKIDFDVAIIGCGAYGFPLGAQLKKSGKVVIHLGGVTQILFGIKGKRWEQDPFFEYIQCYFNEAWVNPDESDRPRNADKVEGGCYW